MEKNTNFFGGTGYLTDEERKRRLEHGVDYFSFCTNVDLSEPIKVVPYGSATEISVDNYSRDVASFFCWWTRNVHASLNGFSGFSNVKFELIGFKIV